MQEFLQPTKIVTNWIETLAIEEINMEESGVVQFNDHLNPDRIIEESGLKLMDKLKALFDVYVTKFNEYRGQNQSIKTFKISNTINDFMLFRNSLKLIVARKSADLISIGFLSNAGGLFSARLNDNLPASNTPHEIRAALGPFNEVSWHFNGEKVNLDALVRHYLTEFIKHSAR